MESQYIQRTLTVVEILYLRETMESLGFKQKPTVRYEDNDACIKLSQNTVCRGRSKHLNRRWHFIRECVIERQEITLEPINTSEQITNTKFQITTPGILIPGGCLNFQSFALALQLSIFIEIFHRSED